jgi:hypothetical protein
MRSCVLRTYIVILCALIQLIRLSIIIGKLDRKLVPLLVFSSRALRTALPIICEKTVQQPSMPIHN